MEWILRELAVWGYPDNIFQGDVVNFFYCVFCCVAHTVCQGVFHLLSSRIYSQLCRPVWRRNLLFPGSLQWFPHSDGGSGVSSWGEASYIVLLVLPYLCGDQITQSSRALLDLSMICRQLLGYWKGKEKLLTVCLSYKRNVNSSILLPEKFWVFDGAHCSEAMSGCVTLKLCEVLHTILFSNYFERYLKLFLFWYVSVNCQTVQHCLFSVTLAGLNRWKLITVKNSGRI